jgi:hypothetical protein
MTTTTHAHRTRSSTHTTTARDTTVRGWEKDRTVIVDVCTCGARRSTVMCGAIFTVSEWK